MSGNARSALAWLALATLATLAGCEARPPAPPAARGLSAYTVWFEPPLTAAGEVSVAHESGYAWRGRASASSARFEAPSGPCTLTLWRQGARVAETTLTLSEDLRELQWRRER